MGKLEIGTTSSVIPAVAAIVGLIVAYATEISTTVLQKSNEESIPSRLSQERNQSSGTWVIIDVNGNQWFERSKTSARSVLKCPEGCSVT